MGKFSLRAVLILPFVVQTVATVGLVGYLSFRNGQQAVNSLVSQMMESSSASIQHHLQTYTALPHAITQLMADDLALGTIRLEDTNLQSLDAYFLGRIQTFTSVSFIYLGDERGYFIGAGPTQRHPLYSAIVEVTDATTGGHYLSYGTNDQGDRVQQIQTFPNYDPRRRPWYQAAVAAGRATWSDIYAFIGEANEGLTITAVRPLQNAAGQLAGVAAVDLYLNDMDQFLQQQAIKPSGRVFILEPNGLLVASSSEQPNYRRINQRLQRLPVIQSQDPLVQAAATYLLDEHGHFDQIQTTRLCQFNYRGAPQWIQVRRWQDGVGLDWLIVTVVPEADYMEHIHANTQRTIALCGAALLVSLGIGTLTARWITHPLRSLNKAARKLATGAVLKPVAIRRVDEVGQLAQSFNWMANQLNESFSELQNLNTALRESEQSLHQILEALPIGVAVVDPCGRMTYTNQVGEHLLGNDQRSSHPLDHPAAGEHLYLAGTDRPYPRERLPLARALQGEAAAIDDGEVHYGDGRVVALEIQAIPVCDDQDRILFAIATVQDINQRKQAERLLTNYQHNLEQQVAERTLALEQEIKERRQAEIELKRQRAFLHQVLNVVPSAIFVKDREGRIIILNQAAADIYGTAIDEQLGKTDHDFNLDRGQVQQFLAVNQTVMETQRPYINPAQAIATLDGQWRWYHTIINPFADAQGTVQGIIGASTDITQLKQVEAALRRAKEDAEAANRAKNLFLAHMSHELRTPLHAILGFSKLMYPSANLFPQQKRNLEIIQRSGEHLLRLINQVLDLSKIEAGHMPVTIDTLDIRRWLADLEAMFLLKASEKGLTLRINCAPDVPDILRIDVTKVSQVLMNLLSNAIKFTQQGMVTVRVDSRCDPADAIARTLQIDVTDTGVGLAADEFHRLFQPFVQTQLGQQVQGGSGLGLSISYQFVRLMGGTIEVISNGYQFIPDLPVSLETPEPDSGRSPGQESSLPPENFQPALPANSDHSNKPHTLPHSVLQVHGTIHSVPQRPGTTFRILIPLHTPPGVSDYSSDVATNMHSPIPSEPVSPAPLTDLGLEHSTQPEHPKDILNMSSENVGMLYPYGNLYREETERLISPDSSLNVPSGNPSLSPTLTANDVSTLPDQWKSTFYRATLEGNLEELEGLVADLHSHDPTLADTIHTLVHYYHFEHLLALFQPITDSDG